ncbi:c-type cytochrome [Aurantimonas marina]|uniref:c-type cytochrome n=1 Tax=Aurantimonas marina TaxID=2780508 RepID=UPI0019D1CEF0|nr:c-type cytochrome [Aurantimonas marina]
MRIDFILTWKKLLLAAIGAVVLAFAFSLSGMISIAASSGHFAPVGWFLNWSMRNAVARQSLTISVPENIDLDDPALVQRAAGHFATGCAPCHGAPGVPQSPVSLSMTPHPPRLSGRIEDWKDRELFWLVKNGLKYTGMPSWATQERNDEIWAQVAFLRALPEMTAERYAELALGGQRGGEPQEVGGETLAGLDGIFENALADCARCHGRDGLGQGAKDAAGAFPVIAGQPEAYLLATLRAYSDGFRHSGLMQPPAKRYDDATLTALAKWYAGQPVARDSREPSESPAPAGQISEAEAEPTVAMADGIPAQIFPPDTRSGNAVVSTAAAGGLPENPEAMRDLGRKIALEGLPARKIPSCESCHGAEGRAKNPHYPYLGGQPEWYARTHLELWKEGTRGGTEFSHLMTPIARNMSEGQIAAVAAWYAEQPTGR